VGLGGEEQVLQVGELKLVGGLRESRQRLLDAKVVDRARIDRERRVRAQAVKAEAPAARGRHRLELAAYAVAPRFVHTEHRRVGRQTQSRARPRFLDDLALELQLVRITRVL